jgi:hypothetical protein
MKKHGRLSLPAIIYTLSTLNTRENLVKPYVTLKYKAPTETPRYP